MNVHKKTKTKIHLLFFFIFSILFLTTFKLFSQTQDVRFYLFISKQCTLCQDIIDLYIEPLREKYPIEYEILDLSKEKNWKLFSRVSDAAGVNSNETVYVLIGDEWLEGEKDIAVKLETLVHGHWKNGGVGYPDIIYVSGNDISLTEKINSFRLSGIFLAGLLDGLNPCAFSTLIFFVSYLLLLKLPKSSIFFSGIIFIVVTFMVYYLIGLGLFKILQEFWIFRKISWFLFKSMGIFLFLLGGLSIYDGFLMLKGRSKKTILQLSNGQKEKIHFWVRKNLRNRNLYLGIAITAFLISLGEFTCTGQIYLPTIMYAFKTVSSSFRVLFLLLLYNTGFILPLIVVFAATYSGTATKNFSSLLKNGGYIVKFGLSMVFFVLGIVLIKT